MSQQEGPRRARKVLLCARPRTCARARGRAWEGMSRRAFLGALSRQDLVVRCHYRVGLVGAVATSAQDKTVLSRQRILYRDRLYNVFYRDREIPVAIDFSRTPVTIEFSLSRQSLHSPMSRQSFMCRDKAWCWEGRRARDSRVRNSAQCALDSAQ